ncbi:MAG TPA: 30S ribosomal protein S20 [Ruminococcaceae bacterium]|mgnify:CR=1 FL=1|jgi:small subunit ribosomal protein S20|nr:30S ribosomal protein S20 [Oscillospiraceae bacterium]HCM22786.1 30S ribosomal protein S20 [Oscillospiraceae bacterium]
MPNIKSAKKRVKVIATKAARNKAISSNLKTDIKKANLAVESGDANKTEAVRFAVKAIDQAVSKGILKKNSAARKKSTLARKLNAAG